MIPVNEPLLNGNEKKYLSECIDTGWISSEGPFIDRFESSFAKYIGRRHAIAVSNGSVALDAALHVLDLKAGDEVIVPSFTIISCASAIIRSGCVPVFVDSEFGTWNIDINLLEASITKNTKAILMVHIYGLPCKVNEILQLATKYGLKVIEDAAEMHGQTYFGKKCGSFGDISTFSFYPNKHITTGEGGMILTDDDHLADRLRSIRNLCFQANKRFVHEELGWNMRMTNLQAAVGVAQLERIEEFLVLKRSMGAKYQKLLAGIPGLILPVEKTEYASNIYWVFGVVIKEQHALCASEAMKCLSALNIGTRPFFWGMHEQPILNRMGFGLNSICPVTENISRKGFYVPSGMAITENQIEEVAKALWKVFS